MGLDDTNLNDPMQPKDDIFNPVRDEEQLPQDGASPAAPADDIASPSGYTDVHPATDTGLDPAEVYDAGAVNAAGLGDQQQDADTHVKPVDLEHQD